MQDDIEKNKYKTGMMCAVSELVKQK